MAVISSMTWLTGWMRPVSSGAGAHRQGDVDRLRGEAADEVLLLEDGAAGGERLARRGP